VLPAAFPFFFFDAFPGWNGVEREEQLIENTDRNPLWLLTDAKRINRMNP
jgi:hypothetical protein